MLRFYEYFDPAQYQNTDRVVSPTVVEENEIAKGHYEKAKYDDPSPKALLTPLAASESTQQ